MIENVRIYVDELAVKHNTDLLRNTLNKNTKIISVIKANGYGLGLVEIARTCEVMNIDILAVLDLPQAIELREAGIKSPILLLGQTHESDFDKLHKYDLIQVLLSYEFSKRLNAYGVEHNIEFRGHLKVNTGLNRLGYDDYELIKETYAMSHINVEGIYSHFVESQSYEDEAVAFSDAQINKFKSVISNLKDEGIDVGLTHMQNSPSILRSGDLGFDAVRCGMVMFGLFHPSQLELAMKQGYKVPIRLESQVAQVREVLAGESIGYAQSYKVTKAMKIATISSGYCDGVMKTLSSNGGCVVINDTLCPILGDIAMSQFMVDVSGLDVKAEDKVIIFGHNLLTLYDYIAITKQSINELIGNLRISIPRIYENLIQ